MSRKRTAQDYFDKLPDNRWWCRECGKEYVGTLNLQQHLDSDLHLDNVHRVSCPGESLYPPPVEAPKPKFNLAEFLDSLALPADPPPSSPAAQPVADDPPRSPPPFQPSLDPDSPSRPVQGPQPARVLPDVPSDIIRQLDDLHPEHGTPQDDATPEQDSAEDLEFSCQVDEDPLMEQSREDGSIRDLVRDPGFYHNPMAFLAKP